MFNHTRRVRHASATRCPGGRQNSGVVGLRKPGPHKVKGRRCSHRLLQALALCVTLGKSLHLSAPQLPHVQNEDKDGYFSGL